MFRKAVAIVTIILSGLSGSIYAQYENVWAFGNKAGINFNTNPPVAIQTSIAANEGCASICDLNGQLLFYTDGTLVWNRNHDTMPNATDLPGLGFNITGSTAQGALIIPMPGSLTRYYVFSMGCWECNQLGRLSYSIIDMSLDNGLGDVVPGSSGTVLDVTLTEHITAVAGNNCDIWLVALSRQNNGQFKAFNISVNGINPVPVTSPAIPSVFGFSLYEEIRGYMDISPDRTKLAIAKSNLTLYSFNPSTGSVTNPVILINNYAGCYGVAFSPDNSKLYVQDVKMGGSYNFGLQQFDLGSGDSLIMAGSRSTIATFPSSSNESVLNGAIKRAPDGKIYCAKRQLNIGSPASYLGVINNPDLPGLACNFIPDGFLLNTGTRSTYGLPNSTSGIFEGYTKSSSYKLICRNNTLSANNPGGANYMWQDGTTGPTHIVAGPGIYWVRYNAIGTQCVEEYTDSFKVLEQQLESYSTTVDLQPCWNDTVVLSASNLSGENYKWENNEVITSRTITQSGTYWITYNEPGNECKQYVDSFFVELPAEQPRLSFDTDSFACQGYDHFFTNTSPAYFNDFKWFFGDGNTTDILSPTHIYGNAGYYTVMLTATHDGNCPDTVYKDIIVDTFMQTVFQVTPQSLCIGQSVHIHHQLVNEGITDLSWSFGDGTASSYKDSSYQHAYDKAGIMYITLTPQLRACPATVYTDSVIVYDFPLVNLGADTAICLKGEPITLTNLHLFDPTLRYQWNTGDTTAHLLVRHPGRYSLTVTSKSGCTTTESVEVNKDCYVDIPNAFTPNGDQENDYFFPRQLLSRSVRTFNMQILNRWGQLIFETNRIDGRGWDGRFNGKDQPGGVYVYLIEVGFENNKPEKYQGNVTLLR